MAQRKFSQFTPGLDIKTDDILVGLRSGDNYQFTLTSGLRGVNEEYLFQWASVGALAVNYPKMTNSATGDCVIYGADGSDANIDICLSPKGTGVVNIVGLGPIVGGPGSSTDNAMARWDGTAGNLLQNSGVIVDDSNNMTGIRSALIGVSPSTVTNVPVIVGGKDGSQSQAAIGLADTFADTTTKTGQIVGLTYDNANSHFVMIRGSGQNGANVVQVGGGGSRNAATQLDFYTAATTSTLTGTLRATINSSGQLLMGTSTPASFSIATFIGSQSGISVGSNLTNSTNKVGNYQVPHYTNSEEPFSLIRGISTASDNTVSIGGKGADRNAATLIEFYTAANNTTLTGTLRGQIDSSGNFLWNTAVAPVLGNFKLSAGWLTITDSDTDMLAKGGGFALNHYLTAEEPVSLIAGISNGTDNLLRIGGGFATANSVTKIQIYTGATDATTTGSRRGTINESGQWLLGNSNEDAATNSTFRFLGNFGFIATTNLMTNTTNKTGGLVLPHYTNTEEPVCLVNGSSAISANIVRIGGGTANANAATETKIYAAANNTTTTGSEIVRYTTDGWSMDAGSNYFDRYEKQQSATGTITCATVGDLSVAYTAQTITYSIIGDVLYFYVLMQFTPTYTTASGQLRIAGFPEAAAQPGGGVVMFTDNDFTWPATATQITAKIPNGTSYIILRGNQTAANTANVNITDFTSGNPAILEVSGFYYI